MAKIDRAAAWAHIDALAAEHSITVRVISGQHGEAHPTTRQVWVPDLRRPIDYLVALHELGHVCSKSALRFHDRFDKKGAHADRAACETAAWSWAVEHVDTDVLPHIGRGTWQRLGALWATYLAAHAEYRGITGWATLPESPVSEPAKAVS